MTRPDHPELADIERRFALLTLRERQEMHLVIKGRTTREIAETLAVSRRTIDSHRAHIVMRMVTNRLARLVRLKVLHSLCDAVPGGRDPDRPRPVIRPINNGLDRPDAPVPEDAS
jgi:DNA-binding CsgD family transcriptional regulator